MKRTTEEDLNKSEFPPKGIQRRTFIKAVLAAGAAGIARPLLATPVPKSGDEVLTKLFGETPITPCDRIAIDMPVLAEDGSVVPIKVQTHLEGVESIALVAEKNPVPLIGAFDLGPGVQPFIATRIKLAESSRVHVVVKTQGRLYSASRFVRVVKGGCE
jgi:sulfur-oxidizing protein SoxY